MFDNLTDLEFALLYRALNTERNTVQLFLDESLKKDNTDTGFLKQVDAIEHMMQLYDIEAEKRYVARNPA